MASLFEVPPGPTTGLQTFAVFVTFFFPAVALVVVVVRSAGRLATKQFGLDDWLVSIAMFLSLAETVASYFFIKTNFIGIHTEDVPPGDPTVGRIWNYGVQILYNPILALVKSSVLIFLLRLFGQQKGGVRRLIIGLNAVNLLQMVGVFLAILLQCQPIAFNWDPTIRGGRCVEQRVLYTSTAAFNIVTDLAVLGLPLYIFADLKIPRRTKFALLFVFLLGFLVTITSVARMVIIVQASFGLVVSDDPRYNIGFVTSAIETNLAIITASAPALRTLARDWKPGGWLPGLTRRSGDVEMASAARGRDGTGTRGRDHSRSKLSRGNSRRARRLRNGRPPDKSAPFQDVRSGKAERELRSRSPRRSEEEAMTINGPMRVSDIQREIDGLVDEIGYGAGAGAAGGAGGRRFAERYYSESVYPDAEYGAERDLNEERLSRYGDKRFGVVTPKNSSGWGSGGRPF